MIPQILLAGITLVSLVAFNTVRATFAGNPECTPPTSISSDLAPFSAFPHAVADKYGRLHTVWSSGVTEGRNEEQVQTDTIFYTVWESGHWTRPVDILTDSDYATADSIVVTTDDRLLVSWRNRDGLFVSQAVLDKAGSAKSWRTQDMTVGSAADSDLFVDDKNIVHLIVSTHTPALGLGALNYMYSRDDGETWSDPVEFNRFDGSKEVNTNLQIYADSSGKLHTVWNRNAADEDWLPTGVYYATSDDSGHTWSSPEEVFNGPRSGYPNLSQGAQTGRLYLNWLRGVGYQDSKYLRSSDSDGTRWTDPQLIFQNLQGLNGAMPIVHDSAETEYWVMSGDTSDGSTQIHYSRQSGDSGWTTPISISPDLRDSEFPEAAIINGNQLHIVWNEFITDDVYHVVCELDAPTVAPAATPTPGVVVTALDAEPIPTATTVATVVAPQGNDLSRVTAAPIPDVGSPTSSEALLLAVIPSVLIVAGVVLWQTGNKRRRR